MSGAPHDKTKHRCRCNRCGARFNIWTEWGPTNICTDCMDILLGIIYGGTVTGRDKFGNIIVERK